MQDLTRNSAISGSRIHIAELLFFKILFILKYIKIIFFYFLNLF